MSSEAKWQVRANKYRREQAAPARGKGTHFIWRIAGKDIPHTRPDHLRLNGKMFRRDDPPVHDTRTGQRGHPGMDRHCRCTAEPVRDPPRGNEKKERSS